MVASHFRRNFQLEICELSFGALSSFFFAVVAGTSASGVNGELLFLLLAVCKLAIRRVKF